MNLCGGCSTFEAQQGGIAKLSHDHEHCVFYSAGGMKSSTLNGALQACMKAASGSFHQILKLRKEPVEGYTTTLEAVARWLPLHTILT